jgi:hypothetical protein
MLRPIEGDLADKIFDILVQECDANENGRDQFIHWATEDDGSSKEYRFFGMFGMAGKIWLERDGIRVSGYNHAELAEKPNADELKAAVEAANKRLTELCH